MNAGWIFLEISLNFLLKKFCSSEKSCTFALAFDKEHSSRESDTILENIPYRHSSTAVFVYINMNKDCTNYTGTKIRTVNTKY